MKNFLFITWDGPQTSYMEGLFMPIFQEIAKTEAVQFHIIQFTWASAEKTTAIKTLATQMGIHYTAFPILKKPIASVGSLFTLFGSSKKIASYIQQHRIDIVMPRSTFPAFMVNQIKNKNFKIIFDADGLAIDERVDFAGLQKDSLQYRWLKSIEQKMLVKADAVITRSQKAIDIHLEKIGEQFRDKFFVVFNGRDTAHFSIDVASRKKIRSAINISDDTLLFVYAGSLGPQYCFPEMLNIVRNYSSIHSVKFLVLTGNTEFAISNIPQDLQTIVTVQQVQSSEVGNWLNSGDVAFALRQPSYSMQGVAPIKLGEYLLCGLPTIASKGIGDTSEIIKQFPECLLYDHTAPPTDEALSRFIENANFAHREAIRQKALNIFSLEAAAESYINSLSKLK